MLQLRIEYTVAIYTGGYIFWLYLPDRDYSSYGHFSLGSDRGALCKMDRIFGR